MKTSSTEIERTCRESLERYFGRYPDAGLRQRSMKALRLIIADGGSLAGKPNGWAAGIIYYVANQDRQACGAPGLLNSEFESFFGVTMGTIRKRAAQVEILLTV